MLLKMRETLTLDGDTFDNMVWERYAQLREWGGSPQKQAKLACDARPTGPPPLLVKELEQFRDFHRGAWLLAEDSFPKLSRARVMLSVLRYANSIASLTMRHGIPFSLTAAVDEEQLGRGQVCCELVRAEFEETTGESPQREVATLAEQENAAERGETPVRNYVPAHLLAAGLTPYSLYPNSYSAAHAESWKQAVDSSGSSAP